VATCGFEVCPSGKEIKSFEPPQGGRILDRYGVLLGRLQQVRRVNVPLDAVPAQVRAAFIATEDRRFYSHKGLDWKGFGRAVVRNVAAGGVREGFSTITMQVARNTFVARRFDERSLRKKLIELRVARLIERNLTKNRILELYLNVIYLGNGTYGVEAASRDLFGKNVNKLSLSEAAVLAALPKAPSRYTPRKSAKRATERRNLVLQLMVREGYVKREQAVAAAGQPLRIARTEWRPPEPNASYALDEVRSIVDSALGTGREEIGDLVVFTSLDATARSAALRRSGRRERWWRSIRAMATSAQWSEVARIRAKASTARPARAASRAPRSSHSFTPPRSRADYRPARWWMTSRSKSSRPVGSGHRGTSATSTRAP
jgi:penicillin-binding protein 1A